MGRTALPLTEHISIRPHFRRSINLERDATTAAVQDYIPTARALDVLRRLAEAMSKPPSIRAFSLTGPYGAGKSSFALFLSALLGPGSDGLTRAAIGRLADFDQDVVAQIAAATSAFGAGDDGFIRAVATADREPVALTVGRALASGAERFFGSRIPRALKPRLKEAGGSKALNGRALAALVGELSAHAPVLLVIDEFGKNLEYFAQSASEGDLFLVQELAESVSGETGQRAMIVTLQHLAFDQYAAAAPTAQRREWSKVQGRFNDISFLHDADQTVRLIELSLDASDASPRVRRDIREWARTQFTLCEAVGLAPQLIETEGRVAACYPVNPVTALVIAELCSQFGQHDRTLFSFLASGEPGSVAAFLQEQAATPSRLPSLALDDAWDYFLESASTSVRNSGAGARWLEIESRIREVRGLSDLDLRCVKAVGLLNLVARGGSLRASPAIVAAGLGMTDAGGRRLIGAALRRLESAGVVTHREFAGEYRVWEGTDFDIAGALESARARLDSLPTSALIERVAPLRPVVASRHSQRVGMLRYFEIRFVESGDALPVASREADGLLAVIIGEGGDDAASPDGRPVVSVRVKASPELRTAAVEAAAAIEVLSSDGTLAADRVAKREVQERAAATVQALRQQLDRFLSDGDERTGGRIGSTHRLGFSRVCSELCDRVYSAAPEVRNEMLGRRDLTSQGAKARRELLAAMLSRSAVEALGMDHFGPERAMYEAALRYTEIHRCDSEGAWSFGPPPPESSWRAAWDAAEGRVRDSGQEGVGFDELYALLASPPFGLKEGPIPVLLTAILLAHRDEIAVYQEGTYQPELTPELLERLVKTPQRFAAKAVEVDGLRRQVVNLLADALGALPPPPRRRNATVLRVVTPVLSAVRALPEYTRRTAELSEETIAIRAALVAARDPSELLFDALPAACGLRPVSPNARANTRVAGQFVERVTAGLEELGEAYERMVMESAAAVAAAFAVPDDMPDLRMDLRARARPLEGRVIDPGLRSFLLAALDTVLDNGEWLEALLFNVSGAAPNAWRDEDVARFRVRLAELAGAFRRVEALHYDTVAAERAGFDARRVTVTAPTGQEISSVYWVDHAMMDLVDDVAAAALAQLEPVLGSRALPGLIALLAARASESAGEEAWAETQGDKMVHQSAKEAIDD